MSVSALGGCLCQMQREGELQLRAGTLKTLSLNVPCITERLLMGCKESNWIKSLNVITTQFYVDFKH